ncbi:MAG: hypothetical protein NC039_03230 [Muribaculaceae bacterium]|nr:hypothetical protein [Muribaculaceae bacterium]
MRLHLSLILLLAALCAQARGVLDDIPQVSPILPGFREDSVRARMYESPLHEVEGLWEVAGEGTLMAVERVSSTPALYVMAVVYSADAALRPGTVMGWLTPGASAGSFDSRIYSSRRDEGTLLSSPAKYSARLADDGTSLTISPYGRKFRLNWWRLLLPYMYRSLVTPMERTKGNIEGFRRVYPESTPLNPRYL